MSGRDPVPIGGAIQDVLQRRGWSRQFQLARVHAGWGDVAGATVAAHCTPVRLDPDGTLEVQADSSAWATQLSFLQGTLLDRLAKVCGPGLVKQVRVSTAGGRNRRAR